MKYTNTILGLAHGLAAIDADATWFRLDCLVDMIATDNGIMTHEEMGLALELKLILLKRVKANHKSLLARSIKGLSMRKAAEVSYKLMKPHNRRLLELRKHESEFKQSNYG